jgi:hypothetical protein
MQLRMLQSVHRLSEKIDAGKLIAISREHQDRARNPAPVVGSQLLGMAGAVERVAEQDETRRSGLCCDHARDPSAERMTADHRGRQVWTDLIA